MPHLAPMTVAEIASRILQARRALAGVVYRTPLESSAWLSHYSEATVLLKLECYQPTGSFKVRGASAAIARLDQGQRPRGVVTASAGNHGLGVAYAAQRAGIRATVVVPEGASPAKVAALGRFPIHLVTAGPSYDTAEREARRIEAETGAVFVSPYNDPDVIAGQGTIGVELLDDEPALDAVLIPVGGGGLISGIGSWLKTVRPSIRIIGVQSVASPAMTEALKAGQRVEIDVLPTLADGLAANIEAGSLTFGLASAVVDEMVLVSEKEIGQAVGATFRELHVPVEGSGVVGIAALLNGRIADLAGQRVGLIITGRNIAVEKVCALAAK